jgi:hypothetical protein
MPLGDAAAPAQVVQDLLEFFGEVLEHRGPRARTGFRLAREGVVL